MEFTGERMIPEFNKGGETYLEHMTRYIFASKFVKGKRVLDIACGSGYGSKIISDAGAENVFGVDVSNETILYCKDHVYDEKIKFIQGSVANIPIDDKSVDIVVSFETIEHVDEKTQHIFLKEVKRVLKYDGLFIVSTPNSLIYPKGNEFHIHEMEPDEFRQAVSDNFKKSEMYYQDDVASSYIFSEKDAKKENLINFIEPNVLNKSEYMISVCSDVEFKSDFNFIGLTEWRPYKEIQRKNQEIEQKGKELQMAKREIEAMKNTKAWRLAEYLVYFLKKVKLISTYPKELIKLSKIALNEFQTNGLDGVIFSFKRYLKQRKGEIPVFYEKANDHEKGLVTIAILTKNRIDLIKPCIESIEKNLSEKYKVEILIGDTGSTEKAVWNFYAESQKKFGNIRVEKFKTYLFSKNYNDLIKNASGQYLIFLNNDPLAKAGWIDNLIDPLEDKHIGIVGAKLLYQDNTIQHAGIEFNSKGNGYHVFKNEPQDLPEANVQSMVPGVTFACVSMRHDVFDRFKLSEDFREEAQDTDFCFRLKNAGFAILYNPKNVPLGMFRAIGEKDQMTETCFRSDGEVKSKSCPMKQNSVKNMIQINIKMRLLLFAMMVLGIC